MSRRVGHRRHRSQGLSFQERAHMLGRAAELKRPIDRERYGTGPRTKGDRFLYFIQAGDDGPIKIGIATDVNDRLASLQTGCPYELRVLASVPLRGRDGLEWFLHQHLAEHRLRGEWFAPAPVLAFLETEDLTEKVYSVVAPTGEHCQRCDTWLQQWEVQRGHCDACREVMEREAAGLET